MEDRYGLVPPEVRARVEAEEYNDRQAKAGVGISTALRALDPDLDLVFVRHDAAPEILPPGAVPGRWHVRNKSAFPIPTFSAVETPEGGYREPDSGILHEYAGRDMRKADVRAATFDRPHREKRDRERKKALETEQRRDELASDLKTGRRIPGDRGMHKRLWDRGGAPSTPKN